MTTIPLIETHNLRLVAPADHSVELYEKFYTDQKASALYGGPLSKDQTFARLKADLGSWYLLGFGVWVIQEKTSNELIGTCGFWQGKGWPVELTWWILPEYRGKGYAFEASKAAIDHAYQTFLWPKVETYMNDDNVAARGLVLKLGGIKSGRAIFPDGLQRDIYLLPAS
jgi:ribosomal-protein-alanine N-acetyltransferase